MSILRTRAEQLLLGIDLETSRSKLAAIVPTGRVIATAFASYPTDRSASGHAEQDAGHWWAALRTALHELGGSVDLKRIAAIGVAGQMHGVVAVNSRGRAGPVAQSPRVGFDRAIEVAPRTEGLAPDAFDPGGGDGTIRRVRHPTLRYHLRDLVDGVVGGIRC